MKAEIIAVGSELLMGEVINANAAWLSRALAALGVDVHGHVSVGDNPGRIETVVNQAAQRADLLIFTGGLGPTADDLTVATLARIFQTPLTPDEETEARIRDYFSGRSLPLSESNLKQALRPVGAQALPNPVGTAPGLAWEVAQGQQRLHLLAFPGVPKELYALWPQGADWIRQWQAARGETPQVLVSRQLQFFGIGEARLGELLSDLMAGENPTVAPYVGQAEVRIRIAAKAAGEAEAERLLAPVQAEILRRCGDNYYGLAPLTLEQAVGAALIERGQTLSVAESCTGGLLSHRLTNVPGSSAYTRLNLVTYANAEKTRLLGVSPDLLAAEGAVSAAVAEAMAIGARAFGAADWGVGITGIAGPSGGTDEKPVGLAYVAVAGPEGPVRSEHVRVNGRYAREDIKHWFTQYALRLLLQALRGKLAPDDPPAVPAFCADFPQRLA